MEELRRLIRDLRTDYKRGRMGDDKIKNDPFQQFSSWFNDTLTQNVPDANAMTLATVDASGKPAARIVLLKDFSPEGFTFYTNYKSGKAKEIAQNPNVSLLFFWPQLERQVRIDGIAEKVSEQESDDYFASRPRESKLGAWASPQSEVLENKKALLDRLEDVIKKFGENDVLRPDYWGGFSVKPHVIEFWQGGPGRLHDRFRYSKMNNGEWEINRLAP